MVRLYVKDKIAVSQIPDLDQNDIEILWLKLSFGRNTVYFGVCYRPPGQSKIEIESFLETLELQLEKILGMCKTPNSTLVLTGDFNDRTSEWHSPHPSSELGPDLYNLLNRLYLSQLISEPTRMTNILDLIITNNPRQIIESGVLNPIDGLDHCPVYGKLNYTVKHNKIFTRNIWNYSTGNYTELNNQLSQIPWGMVINESDNIDDAVDMTTDLILQCCKNCIPNKTIKIHPRDKPGMTTKVKYLLSIARKLHKRAQRSGTLADIEKHHEARSLAKKEWHQAQKEYHQKIERQLDTNKNNSRTYWRIVKHVIGNSTKEAVPCIIDGNIIADSNIQKAEILNNYFASQSTIPPPPIDHQLPPLNYLTDNKLHTIQTTPHEVFKILNKLNPNKASGPDLINNRILKESAVSLCEPLSDLFNKSFITGHFPRSWKCANVTPIHKKGCRQTKSNYRPISLLSNISKVQERIVYNRLYQHCLNNNLLTERNSGFKQMDSTINRLIHLTNMINRGLDDKKEILIVFLDITKAFDRVWHPGLLHKLKQFGVTGSLLSWFESYLFNRSQKVVLGGEESSILATNAGVPQGSILGPLLFLIFINDIVSIVENEIFLFADDSSLLKAFNNPTLAELSINKDLDNLSKWAKTWLVRFNPQKTVYMVISNKTSPSNIELSMNNTSLKRVTSECYLGVLLSSNMSWKGHIQKTIAKASGKIGILFKMRTQLPRSALSKYYISFIRPVLEYGSVVFDNCTNHESFCLEQVQRRAAILCTGSFKRSSYNRLLRELGWDTLQNRRTNSKLVLFKILNNLTPNYLKELIPPLVQTATPYSLRTQANFRIPFSRTNLLKRSFIPSTLRLWNSLDMQTRDSKSLNSFKYKLKFKANSMCKIYSLSFGPCTRYLTQLRLGLSKLNSHLFTIGVTQNPYCPNCTNPVSETIPHYLLVCTAYAAQRDEMLRSLGDVLPRGITSNKTKLAQILTHGSETYSHEVNVLILTASSKFIHDTQRFLFHN